ncbi:MAG: hypothetical protein KF862_04695 [Chitinophagaceae bacterium]|nr:hypothetical protein [Chitinophagaceae bacterium]
MASPVSPQTLCLNCNKPVKGRIDKKFCDDWCRNAYNNKLNSITTSLLVRTINSILKRNRKILESLISPEKETVKASRKKLIEMGFRFEYITHLFTTQKGQTYFFCYEYGYLPLENDFYLIVARNRDREEKV